MELNDVLALCESACSEEDIWLACKEFRDGVTDKESLHPLQSALAREIIPVRDAVNDGVSLNGMSVDDLSVKLRRLRAAFDGLLGADALGDEDEIRFLVPGNPARADELLAEMEAFGPVPEGQKKAVDEIRVPHFGGQYRLDVEDKFSGDIRRGLGIILSMCDSVEDEEFIQNVGKKFRAQMDNKEALNALQRALAREIIRVREAVKDGISLDGVSVDILPAKLRRLRLALDGLTGGLFTEDELEREASGPSHAVDSSIGNVV